jgi:hypothetical protein
MKKSRIKPTSWKPHVGQEVIVRRVMNVNGSGIGLYLREHTVGEIGTISRVTLDLDINDWSKLSKYEFRLDFDNARCSGYEWNRSEVEPLKPEQSQLLSL